MTVEKALGPRTEKALHLGGPLRGPSGLLFVAARLNQGARKDPHRMHNGGSRVASGGGAAETP